MKIKPTRMPKVREGGLMGNFAGVTKSHIKPILYFSIDLSRTLTNNGVKSGSGWTNFA